MKTFEEINTNLRAKAIELKTKAVDFANEHPNEIATAIIAAVGAAGAFVLGKRKGYDKCVDDVTDECALMYLTDDESMPNGKRINIYVADNCKTRTDEFARELDRFSSENKWADSVRTRVGKH